MLVRTFSTTIFVIVGVLFIYLGLRDKLIFVPIVGLGLLVFAGVIALSGRTTNGTRRRYH